MYAVIETGGKQIKVEPGQKFRIEKLPVPPGKEISFDRVLLLRDGERIMVGRPYVEGVVVNAEVLEQIKDKKVTIFKHKRRKNYRKKIGHRQPLTVITVKSITGTSQETPEAAGAE